MKKHMYKETNWEAVVAIAIAILLAAVFICTIAEAIFTINLSNIMWLLVAGLECGFAVLALYIVVIRSFYNKKQK